MSSIRIVRRAVTLAAAVLPIALVASASHAEQRCHSVEGRYTERDASGAGCTSAVGLCLTAQYMGDVRGPAATVVSTVTGTADTGATAVLLFTADSTITARVEGRKGTLTIKNAGALRLVGEGSIVDLQAIVGGTGGLAGATGDLRATGVFTAGAGQSTYEGTVCLP